MNFKDQASIATHDAIVTFVDQMLRAQKIDEYEPNKQDALKDQIKTELNKQLGEGSVYAVYITNFVFQ